MIHSFGKLEAIGKDKRALRHELSVVEPEIYEDEKETPRSIDELLIEENYIAIIKNVQASLIKEGVIEAEGLDPSSPVVALALAEATNLAAKEIDYAFYQLKPPAIVAAWKMGCHFGYNQEDETYSLFHPDIGTASFHDPGHDLQYLIEDVLDEDIPEWPYEWSGVGRQDLAFKVLDKLKKIDDMIIELIKTTTPEQLIGKGIDFNAGRKESLLERYGKNSIQIKLRDFVLASEDEQVRNILTELKKDYSKL